jgi:hypothetical protein
VSVGGEAVLFINNLLRSVLIKVHVCE